MKFLMYLFTDRTESDKRLKRATGLCKNAVGAFSHSWKRKRDMTELQEKYDLPKHALITECSTRWGSRCRMIERFLEQKKALTEVLENDKKTRHLVPTWQDTDVLKSVLAAIKPLLNFTDSLSGEKYVSVSCVKPVLDLFRDEILKVSTDDTTLTKDLKEKIQQYMDDKYHDDNVNRLLDMAGLCDPRFKLQHTVTEQKENIKHLILEEMDNLNKVPSASAESTGDSQSPVPSTSECEDLPAKKRRTLGSLLKRRNSADSLTKSMHEELSSYLAYQQADTEECPLEWWRQNEKRFPNLATVAKKYLAIPATSSASERVFSTGGNIVSPQRSRLNPDKVNMLIFLSHNDF